jgi:hypothetical protein
VLVLAIMLALTVIAVVGVVLIYRSSYDDDG